MAPPSLNKRRRSDLSDSSNDRNTSRTRKERIIKKPRSRLYMNKPQSLSERFAKLGLNSTIMSPECDLTQLDTSDLTVAYNRQDISQILFKMSLLNEGHFGNVWRKKPTPRLLPLKIRIKDLQAPLQPFLSLNGMSPTHIRNQTFDAEFRCTEGGAPHPDFPKTYMDYLLLTESQLDSLYAFYANNRADYTKSDPGRYWNSYLAAKELAVQDSSCQVSTAYTTHFAHAFDIEAYTIRPDDPSKELARIALSDEERLEHKKWMFGYFIGVHDIPLKATHRMRLKRFDREFDNADAIVYFRGKASRGPRKCE
ncbi:hypothetical protein BT63DRAFT_5361 [Microthyrium microscopicum]|uniref:Uncharacterized protein n=1 Tax=Microthyrium microscopicum TaxID=703497 RepID=A0A6A6UR58_9PEZI|nr:hypothetical protein BT63DRAFT_5361 [Microthyrium microscopicum]